MKRDTLPSNGFIRASLAIVAAAPANAIQKITINNRGLQLQTLCRLTSRQPLIPVILIVTPSKLLHHLVSTEMHRMCGSCS